jgi:Gamma-glutamyl cyclotransferase, AIG2-like
MRAQPPDTDRAAELASGRRAAFTPRRPLRGAQVRQRRRYELAMRSARIEARAVLPNQALAFGGFSQRWGGAVANVVPEPGARVEGLLYRSTAPDLRALDRHEGFPFAYERILKLVTDERGRRRRAQVYRQPADTFEP